MGLTRSRFQFPSSHDIEHRARASNPEPRAQSPEPKLAAVVPRHDPEWFRPVVLARHGWSRDLPGLFGAGPSRVVPEWKQWKRGAQSLKRTAPPRK